MAENFSEMHGTVLRVMGGVIRSDVADGCWRERRTFGLETCIRGIAGLWPCFPNFQFGLLEIFLPVFLSFCA